MSKSTCISFALTVALGLGLAACQKKKTAAEIRAEKEKVWRVEQRSRAAKYYHDLIEKYPDSQFVAEAKQRLAAMGPVATPKPAPK